MCTSSTNEIVAVVFFIETFSVSHTCFRKSCCRTSSVEPRYKKRGHNKLSFSIRNLIWNSVAIKMALWVYICKKLWDMTRKLQWHRIRYGEVWLWLHPILHSLESPLTLFFFVFHWLHSCWYHWKAWSYGPDGHEWNMYIEKLAHFVRDIERESYIFPIFLRVTYTQRYFV